MIDKVELVPVSYFPQCSTAWFAVYVKCNYEHRVARLLQSAGYEHILPVRRVRRKWADRLKTIEEPLFSQYLFCRCSRQTRIGVLRIPGVLDIVGKDGGEPVSDAEITSIRRATESQLSCEAANMVTHGQTVLLAEGPLAGLRGLFIQEKALGKFVISVSLLQRSLLVEVDPDWLIPIGQAPGSEAAARQPSVA